MLRHVAFHALLGTLTSSLVLSQTCNSIMLQEKSNDNFENLAIAYNSYR